MVDKISIKVEIKFRLMIEELKKWGKNDSISLGVSRRKFMGITEKSRSVGSFSTWYFSEVVGFR